MNTKLLIFFTVCLILAIPEMKSQNLPVFPKITPAGKKIVNTNIDNMGYWNLMAKLRYVEYNPYVIVEDPVFTGSRLQGDFLFTQDSPDIPVTSDPETTQSENSVFIDPDDEDVLLNSNNSSDWTGATANNLYGCDAFFSMDAATTWGGSIYGVGVANSGDPAVAIGKNGRWYAGKINNGWGQSVAYSDNEGQTWTEVIVAPGAGGWNLYDKNHLWIDNGEDSPFEGYLYDAWTNFVDNSPNEYNIEITRSTDHGLTWSAPYNISENINAGNKNQGVNLHTGPNGELYAVWAVYDSWPADEVSLGFARSFDGGGIFSPGYRIISNIKGIRTSGTHKGIRVNSFPVMAVDNSNGPNRGTIYVVWANIGEPWINSGPDIDIYLIRSSDQGDTWSTPVKVNQDPSGLGKEHFFPWITCDQTNGNLCVIYYDDRNVSQAQLETWVSYSYDAGNTWSDMKVSDVAFTPAPIPGMAANYMGDYLGIASYNMKVYPTWTDNRSGRALTYVSPFDLGPPPGQPYVVYYTHTLNPIVLDSRQTMNFGDSLYLTVGLKNIGDLPASNLVVTVKTGSPYITITDSLENYENMAPGEIKEIPDGFALNVSDSIPDALKIKFNVQISDGDTTWNSHFSVESHAPALQINNLVILDSPGGNGNGRMDPGETAEIRISVSNTGDFPCVVTNGHISTGSSFLTFGYDSVYLDTLNPGQEKTAIYPVTVDEEATVGTGTNLFFRVKSGLYQTSANFIETIGIIVEDWETNTFTKFPWVQGGVMPWRLSGWDPYEGILSAVSGAIVDYQTSTLSVVYTSGVADSISFYRKVSSEQDFDYLFFYIDDVQLAAWSGNVPWGRVSFYVSEGTHSFEWVYSKDIFMSVGTDRAWIDYIDFPPPVLPIVHAGPDDTICAGELFTADGFAVNYDSVDWRTYGDGTFDSIHRLHPVYTPGINDILDREVKLLLRAYANYGSAVNSMILSIGDIPAANITAEPNDTLCSWQSGILSLDSLPGASYLWTPGALHTPEITVDTSVAGGIGTAIFHVQLTNLYGCTCQDSIPITFLDCSAIEESPDSFTIHIAPNPTTGLVHLRLHTPFPELVNIRLTTATHQIVMEEKDLVIPGDLRKQYDLEHLPSGVYFLVIERNSEKITRKIIRTD